MSRFLADGLAAADSALIIATAAHCKSFCAELAQRGLDVPALTAAGRLTLFDAEVALAAFLRDGQPDRALFETVIGKTVADAAVGLKAPARLLAYGEMVDLLWSGGQRAAAIQLEELWSELQKQHPFTLFCAYDVARFEDQLRLLKETCDAHTHLEGLPDARTGVTESGVFSGREGAGLLALASEVTQRKSVEWALRRALRDARRSEDAARTAARQLELVTDALPVLVSYIDREHRYRFVNQNYERWFGAARTELVGRHARDVLGPAAYEQLLPYFEAALAGSSANFRSRAASK